MGKNVFMGLAVVVLLGVGIWYSGVLTAAPEVPATSNTEGNQQTSSFAKLAANAIYVAPQRPGKEIIVTTVNMEAPGYVVIHESVDGKPGAIIGHSALLSDRTNSNITIPLTRTVKDGEALIAMLHTEKGNTGFDANTDLPVLDSENNSIYMNFSVSVDASDPSSTPVMF